jgi:hypothetical protein
MDVIKKSPHRHFVFSIPKILRRYLLYDRKLFADLSRCIPKPAASDLLIPAGGSLQIPISPRDDGGNIFILLKKIGKAASLEAAQSQFFDTNPVKETNNLWK